MAVELRSGLLVELGWDIDLARVRLGYDMVRIQVRYEGELLGRRRLSHLLFEGMAHV